DAIVPKGRARPRRARGAPGDQPAEGSSGNGSLDRGRGPDRCAAHGHIPSYAVYASWPGDAGSPNTASMSPAHQASMPRSRSGWPPMAVTELAGARPRDAPADDDPGTALGTGTSIVRTAGFRSVLGYSRWTRTCFDSGS